MSCPGDAAPASPYNARAWRFASLCIIPILSFPTRARLRQNKPPRSRSRRLIPRPWRLTFSSGAPRRLATLETASDLPSGSACETWEVASCVTTAISWRRSLATISAMAACSVCHRHTGGVPRQINTLCSRLLLFGFLEERPSILLAQMCRPRATALRAPQVNCPPIPRRHAREYGMLDGIRKPAVEGQN